MAGPGTAVRGVALVERVIHGLRNPDPAERLPRRLRRTAAPLAEPELAPLAFRGGKPLPASLRRWLGFDTRFVGLVGGDAARPELMPLRFRQLVAQEFGRFADDAAWAVFDELLAGDCYLLPGGSDARRFIYVGEADEHGEFPVMCVDTHDIPFVCVYSPGFDVWLAETFRRLPGYTRHTYTDLFDDPVYGAAMAEQARRNFHGFRALDESGQDTAHLDGSDWEESTGVGTRFAEAAAGKSRAAQQDFDDDDEETRPGVNPFTGSPRARKPGF